VKAVIDTNIWISFLIGKLLAGLDDYILDGLLEVIIADEQLEEITSVLRRPKFRPHFSTDDIEEFLSLLYKSARIVEIHNTIKDCRDPSAIKGTVLFKLVN